jgi:phosphatidylglycerol lysyltransferase
MFPNAPFPSRAAMKSKILKYTGALFSLLLFSAALWALHREVQTVHLQHILSELKAIPGKRLWLAAILTVSSYTIMAGYDYLAIRFIKHPLSLTRIALASFIGYAFSNNIGFSMLAGASVRYRLYSSWGLSALEITKVVAFCTLTLWLGFFSMGGMVFVLEPMGIPPGSHIPFHTTLPLGVLFLGILMGYIALTAFYRHPVHFRGWEIAIPSLPILFSQILVACVDWLLGGAVLYTLLPSELPLSFLNFIGVYFLAQMAGLASQVPGGLGVFETAVLMLFPHSMNATQLLGALIAFRGIYYLLPLGVATALLGSQELFRGKEKAYLFLRLFGNWAPTVLPNVLSFSVFIGGGLLMISGATPAIESRLAWLKLLIPLPLLELSHFIGSIAGVALVLLAHGLQRRIDAAYFLTIALIGTGILASLLKGLDYEEALALGLILAVLLPCRRHFYRRASLLSQPINPGWIAAIFIVVAGSIGLGLFAYKHVEISSELWWQFAFSGHASRFLRASVGMLTLVTLWAVGRLLRPAPPSKGPKDMDGKAVKAIVKASPDTCANLALIGDKSFLFSETHNAFIMYAVCGRSWVSMGNPVGPQAEWPNLIWRFRELSDRYDGWTVFYQVDPGSLHYYLDIGLSLLKLGEEAKVPLPSFSLEGGAHKNLRQTCKKATHEGCIFEIVEAGGGSLSVWDEMRSVSAAWLAEKSTREKGFSIGTFQVDYLNQFQTAIVRRGGTMVAFANIWIGAEQKEISVDLMRFSPGASYGVMDFLLTELMLWGKNQNFQWFNLGMAPFTGIENRELSSPWNRMAAFIARHGEHFYNFQGLRQYKEKFIPVWTPKYLATPGGLALPRVIANVTTLISGGIKGTIGK